MAKYCVLFIALPLPVIVRTICLFHNFEKLSMSLGFSKDVLEGWARGCCVHVFLVIKSDRVFLFYMPAVYSCVWRLAAVPVLLTLKIAGLHSLKDENDYPHHTVFMMVN